MMATKQTWSLFEHCPTNSKCKALYAINRYELIASIWGSGITTNGLYKWNILTNEWILIYKYSAAQMIAFSYSLSINKETNKIWLATTNHHYTVDVMIIDLLNYKTECKYNTSIHHLPPYSSSICIDNKLHLIGGVIDAHYIYDQITNNMTFPPFLQQEFGNVAHSLIHLKSKQLLLLIGGEEFKPSPRTYYDDIWCYSLNNKSLKQWKSLNIKLPSERGKICCCLTRNERDIIIFGGRNENGKLNDILLFNLDDMIIKKSKLKCPVKASFFVTITWHKNEYILVQGYIRNFLQYLSNDLIGLIASFYSTEIVHLLNLTGPQHWTLDIDYIYQF